MICAAAAVAASPVYLNAGSMLTTHCLEPCCCEWMRLHRHPRRKHNQPRHWFWFGVVAGIGMQEKYPSRFGFSVVVGPASHEQRRFLFNQ